MAIKCPWRLLMYYCKPLADCSFWTNVIPVGYFDEEMKTKQTNQKYWTANIVQEMLMLKNNNTGEGRNKFLIYNNTDAGGWHLWRVTSKNEEIRYIIAIQRGDIFHYRKYISLKIET